MKLTSEESIQLKRIMKEIDYLESQNDKAFSDLRTIGTYHLMAGFAGLLLFVGYFVFGNDEIKNTFGTLGLGIITIGTPYCFMYWYMKRKKYNKESEKLINE